MIRPGACDWEIFPDNHLGPRPNSRIVCLNNRTEPLANQPFSLPTSYLSTT